MKRVQVGYSYRVYETAVIEVDDDFDEDDEQAVLDALNEDNVDGEDREASVDSTEVVTD